MTANEFPLRNTPCSRGKNACCFTNRAAPAGRRIGLEFVQWLLSAAIVLLAPKCPLCLAGYIALATGIGLSLTIATYLHTSLLAAAGLTLAYLTLRIIARWRQWSLTRNPR